MRIASYIYPRVFTEAAMQRLKNLINRNIQIAAEEANTGDNVLSKVVP